MKAAAPPLPAGTAQAMLAGFGAVGLDVAALARASGVSGLTTLAFDAPVPEHTFAALWREAFRQRPLDDLATRVGLGVPFGAFTTVDYLAASSPTVGAACEALAAWFRHVSGDFHLEVSSREGGGVVEVVSHREFDGRPISDEFTVAVVVGRFARPAVGGLRPTQVRLARPRPGKGAGHEALLGAPVRFGAKMTALEWSARDWMKPLPSADAGLQRTLTALARRLELGPEDGRLVSALRARLRDLLPRGEVSAEEAARVLGLSARTLQRRLADEGTTFREVLDAFREAESERLVAAGHVSLTEVALRVGFSDQTAWNRAFKRWKGVSPGAWARGGR